MVIVILIFLWFLIVWVTFPTFTAVVVGSVIVGFTYVFEGLASLFKLPETTKQHDNAIKNSSDGTAATSDESNEQSSNSDAVKPAESDSSVVVLTKPEKATLQPVANADQQPRENDFELRKGKIVYRIERNCFLTRSNLNYCTSRHHNLADIYGRVGVVMEDKIRDLRFPATYCQTCDKFFVLEHVYNWLVSHGKVLCRIVTADYWLPKHVEVSTQISDSIYGDPESKLHYLGYNVNSQVGLSKAQRRSILRSIIVNHDMTRSEIESHLVYLIRRNEYNPKFQKAIDKWYNDLLYIEDLDLSYSRIPMTALQHNQYHYK